MENKYYLIIYNDGFERLWETDSLLWEVLCAFEMTSKHLSHRKNDAIVSIKRLSKEEYYARINN